MTDKMEKLLDEVIEFVSEGAEGVTDFVQQTAQKYKVTKGDVRAIIQHYNKDPNANKTKPTDAAEVEGADAPGEEE